MHHTHFHPTVTVLYPVPKSRQALPLFFSESFGAHSKVVVVVVWCPQQS